MKNPSRACVAGAQGARALTLTLCAIGLVAAGRCGAVTLQPGDVVMTRYMYSASAEILRLDPTTLASTLISQGPLITIPMDVAVDLQGRILVADYASGVVVVDAASGAQSVLVSNGTLGGAPGGICAAPDGRLYVSVYGPASGVMRVSADGSAVTPVSLGNRLASPGGLAIGPDGALYVTEASLPADNGQANGFQGHGSIVRVDPGTGNQTLVAADALFIGPNDIEFVGPDEVWTMQYGGVAGRRGCFISTTLSDGTSRQANATFDCRSEGLTRAADGAMIVSDCHTIGPDCYTPYTMRLPSGPSLQGVGGHLAVVPQGVVSVHRATWGTLKTIYR
jgi:sugar lactone lactonase YvrE